MYLSRACLDTAELADESRRTGFKDLVGTSIELSRASCDVWGRSADGGDGEESHDGKSSSVDGGELHLCGLWVGWSLEVWKFGRSDYKL